MKARDGILEALTHMDIIRTALELHLLEIFQVILFSVLCFSNIKHYSINFISEELPTSEAMDLAKRLLECGVLLGELEENYRLLGARQVIATESPGLELYGELQDWDHWSPNP